MMIPLTGCNSERRSTSRLTSPRFEQRSQVSRPKDTEAMMEEKSGSPGGCCGSNDQKKECCAKKDTEATEMSENGCCSGENHAETTGSSCCNAGSSCQGNAPCEAPQSASCCDPPSCCNEDSCTEKKSCCAGHPFTLQDDDSPVCLAVIREDGGDIVLFDASGKPRAFRYKGDIRNLCFETHGSSMADDLLTPCFDEDGNHGEPEESCFCGEDGPHLHAHLRDSCGGQGNKTDNINYLATHILHPIDESTDTDDSVCNLGVSESLPKDCNADKISELGVQSDERPTRCKSHSRRVHQVRHDDHIDYLVHK